MRHASAAAAPRDLALSRDNGLLSSARAAQARACSTALIGHYNVVNLLGVIGVLRALGVPLADAARRCAGVAPVPGRMQHVRRPRQAAGGGRLRAHARRARKALAALRPLAQQRGGKLWCVFGCGGDRDAGKRPLMGAIAARLADRVVVTSDNPRSEEPDAIIAQILAGVIGARRAST